jgi:hypothetical protein
MGWVLVGFLLWVVIMQQIEIRKCRRVIRDQDKFSRNVIRFYRTMEVSKAKFIEAVYDKRSAN